MKGGREEEILHLSRREAHPVGKMIRLASPAELRRLGRWQIWCAIHPKSVPDAISFQLAMDSIWIDPFSTCSKWAESGSRTSLPCFRQNFFRHGNVGLLIFREVVQAFKNVIGLPVYKTSGLFIGLNTYGKYFDGHTVPVNQTYKSNQKSCTCNWRNHARSPVCGCFYFLFVIVQKQQTNGIIPVHATSDHKWQNTWSIINIITPFLHFCLSNSELICLIFNIMSVKNKTNKQKKQLKLSFL